MPTHMRITTNMKTQGPILTTMASIPTLLRATLTSTTWTPTHSPQQTVTQAPHHSPNRHLYRTPPTPKHLKLWQVPKPCRPPISTPRTHQILSTTTPYNPCLTVQLLTKNRMATSGPRGFCILSHASLPTPSAQLCKVLSFSNLPTMVD